MDCYHFQSLFKDDTHIAKANSAAFLDDFNIREFKDCKRKHEIKEVLHFKMQM